MAKPSILGIKDAYDRRARLEPALIVALPLALAMLAWSPDGLKGWTILWSLLVWAGGTGLLAQLARDLGKRREPYLFESWGGKPTTRLLRYTGCENEVLIARRHQILQKALPEVRIPTVEDELSNPKHSDDVYETCVRWLIEKTRDKKKFQLVFEENCNYGFRRNLWGMRVWGITIALIAMLISIAAQVTGSSGAPGRLLSFGAMACIGLLLVFWLFACNPEWVRLPADAYAERLLGSADVLAKTAASESPEKENPPVRPAARFKGKGAGKTRGPGAKPQN